MFALIQPESSNLLILSRKLFIKLKILLLTIIELCHSRTGVHRSLGLSTEELTD